MAGPPFVERRFELDGGEPVARFEQPVQQPTGEFRCDWALAWPDREERSHVFGEDAVEALMLALKSLHIELVKSEAYKAGRLTLWTQADLDLPPTWGAGPLYYVPPQR